MLLALPSVLLLVTLALACRLPRAGAWGIAPCFSLYSCLLVLSILNWEVCYSPVWSGWANAADLNGIPVVDWARLGTRWFAVVLPLGQVLITCESFWQTTDYMAPPESSKRTALWSLFACVGATVLGMVLWMSPTPEAPLTQFGYYWRLGLHLGLLAGLVTSLGFLLIMNRRVLTATPLLCHQGILALYVLGSILADLPDELANWAQRTYATETTHVLCLAVWAVFARQLFGLGIR